MASEGNRAVITKVVESIYSDYGGKEQCPWSFEQLKGILNCEISVCLSIILCWRHRNVSSHYGNQLQWELRNLSFIGYLKKKRSTSPFTNRDVVRATCQLISLAEREIWNFRAVMTRQASWACYSQTGCSFDENFAMLQHNVPILIDSLLVATFNSNLPEQVAKFRFSFFPYETYSLCLKEGWNNCPMVYCLSTDCDKLATGLVEITKLGIACLKI